MWTKEKDEIQSLKQNLTQFTWNKLLYCLCISKARIWAWCCYKAWIAWLCWACIFWFCIMSWLGMLSFSSFPFIVFFLQVFWSKFAILFKFFSKKTNHFWATPSTLFLSLVPLSSCSLHVFVSLQIFLLLFFSFIEFLFFVLYIRLSFLSICFGSAFIFVKSPCKVFKKLLISRELFTP